MFLYGVDQHRAVMAQRLLPLCVDYSAADGGDDDDDAQNRALIVAELNEWEQTVVFTGQR